MESAFARYVLENLGFLGLAFMMLASGIFKALPSILRWRKAKKEGDAAPIITMHDHMDKLSETMTGHYEEVTKTLGTIDDIVKPIPEAVASLGKEVKDLNETTQQIQLTQAEYNTIVKGTQGRLDKVESQVNGVQTDVGYLKGQIGQIQG